MLKRRPWESDEDSPLVARRRPLVRLPAPTIGDEYDPRPGYYDDSDESCLSDKDGDKALLQSIAEASKLAAEERAKAKILSDREEYKLSGGFGNKAQNLADELLDYEYYEEEDAKLAAEYRVRNEVDIDGDGDADDESDYEV